MSMLRSFVISLILTIVIATGASAGISISQSLSNNQIAYEDSVRFEIKLVWDGPQMAYRFLKPLSPEIDKMKIRGFSSSISSVGSGDDETTTKTFEYTLIPVSSGLGYISPVSVEYVTWPDSIPGELVTEAQSVQIAEPRPQVESNGSLLPWLLALVGLILAAGIAAFLILRKSRKPEPKLDPAEKFLTALAVAKQDAGNDLKRFQDSLCRILSEYLKSATGLSVEEFDDDRLADELIEGGMNAADAEKLAGWYGRARLDKYRPVKAEPGEVIRLEAEIRSWFEKKS